MMTIKIGSKTIDEEMDELFDLFDKEKSGQIDEKKLMAVCKESGIKITEEEVKLMIEEADVDKNQYVDQSDFRRILRRGY